jgi:hypothetical protein
VVARVRVRAAAKVRRWLWLRFGGVRLGLSGGYFRVRESYIMVWF